eukprot:31125-Pelagococcus_subviridis.AAC.30
MRKRDGRARLTVPDYFRHVDWIRQGKIRGISHYTSVHAFEFRHVDVHISPLIIPVGTNEDSPGVKNVDSEVAKGY